MRDAGFPRGKASLWCIENKWWAKRNNYSPHSVAGRFSPEEWAYVVSVCNHYATLVRSIRKRYRKASVSVGIAKELTRRVKLKSQGRATISLTRLVRFLSGTAGIMPYQIEAVDSALKELEQEAPWLPLVNLQWLKTRLRELGVSLPKACESLGCRLYGKSNRRVLSLWFFHSARRWTFEQAKAVWDLYGSPELLPQPSQAATPGGNGTAGDANQVVRRRGRMPHDTAELELEIYDRAKQLGLIKRGRPRKEDGNIPKELVNLIQKWYTLEKRKRHPRILSVSVFSPSECFRVIRRSVHDVRKYARRKSR
jgi:hypothetical protein